MTDAWRSVFQFVKTAIEYGVILVTVILMAHLVTNHLSQAAGFILYLNGIIVATTIALIVADQRVRKEMEGTA